MIDFRYHVVSIVAVFLALTVGLVLGASFLKGAAVQNLNDSINSLTAQRNSLQQANRTQGNSITTLNTYNSATAPILVQNYLSGQNVVVIEVSGSDPALTAATLTLLGDAGAKVTADITLTPRLTATDASTEAGLTGLVNTVLPPGGSPAAGPAAVQAAVMLAEALTAAPPPVDVDATGGPGTPTGGASVPPTTPPTVSPSGSATSPSTTGPSTGADYQQAQLAISSFGTGGYITINNVPAGLKPAATARPTLAFIAAPTTADTTAQNAAYTSLTEALRADGAMPVMGGAAENNTAGSSQAGGLLDAVLKDGTAAKQIATVDNMNLTIGQVAVVFTLWEAANNAEAGSNAPAKHYGSVGTATQGLLPQLSPLPQPTANPSATATPTAPTSTPAH